ncbi:MAG: cell division protein FtsH, partial [Firmicutes bacterium]|nr:cell division protein FtsH [Bacillota bacterium]
MNTRFLHQATFYLLIFMIAVALISTFGKTNDLVRDVKYYPDFIELIENEDLQEVTIVGRTVEGELTENRGKVRTYKPDDDDLTDRLIANEIPFEAQPEPEPPWWSTLLTYLIPFILIIGVFFFFMQQTQG